MKVREVKPEMLDTLSPADPGALASHRDLHHLNRCLGTFRWFDKTLRPLLRESFHLLEIGAGHGVLSHFLRQRFTGNPPKHAHAWHALDIQVSEACEKQGLTWHQADLKAFEHYGKFDVVFGNFILHQFKDAELNSIGKRLSGRTRMLVFQEPWRQPFFLWGLALIATFMHPVTCNDAPVSVRAGFHGDELPRLLGLNPIEWKVTVEYSPLGLYRMIALR